MSNPLETLRTEGAVIGQAPWSFVICLAVVSSVIFLVLRALKAQQITDLEGRLTLRNDEIADYRRKLDGASPDEARARLDAVEQQLREEIQKVDARIAVFAPRGLTDDQRNLLIAGLGQGGGAINIPTDAAVADAKPYGTQIADAFRIAGWKVQHFFVLGFGMPPAKGFALSVVNPGALSADEERVRAALEGAGIPFEVQSDREMGLVVTAVA